VAVGGPILNNDDKSSCLEKVGSDVSTKPCGLQLVGKKSTNHKVNNIITNEKNSDHKMPSSP